MSGQNKRSSRITGFYRLALEDRLSRLIDEGFVSDEQATLLRSTGSVLRKEVADLMIENVVGVFELPIGFGLNFRINERDFIVPMVVEEPSIVAAVSHAAAIFRRSGGFTAAVKESLMTGQVQVLGVEDIDHATARIESDKPRLLAMANAIHPRMQERGGGARDIEVRRLPIPRTDEEMLVVHLYVDTCDAMGANLINTMAEGLAQEIELITGGEVCLRILSNLTDRRRVIAGASVPVADLAWKEFSGEEVARGVVRASVFAEADPYRAATHNKGIMNGIDAVALATGQDWRAIEAGAHAYASRSGQYGPLARWWVEDGQLHGEIDVPMAVGTVGGPIRLHPTVKVLLDILGVDTAVELAQVMGCVGLAQNFAAIKALGSTGIQRGHMALHARSVAATAGAGPELVEEVARRLIATGEIKVERAREILGELSPS